MKNDINLTEDGELYIISRLIKQGIKVAYAPVTEPTKLVEICNAPTEEFIAFTVSTKPPKTMSLKFVAPKGYSLDSTVITTVEKTVLNSLSLKVSDEQVRAVSYKIGSDDPTEVVEEITAIYNRRRQR